MSGKTLSVVGDAPREETRRGAWLFHVVSCDDVAQPTHAFPLGDVTEIELRRGAAGGERAGRRLTVRLLDARVSELHARLTRGVAGWTLTDEGSKNGSLVNGARVASQLLEDGDLVEVGHTVLRFRTDLPGDDAPGPRDLPTLLPSLRQSYRRLAQVAGSAAPIILRGESGVGKEVVARLLHAWSERRGELVAVNCGAIPPNLVESQLFGHKRGAFSGATDDSPGLVRTADKGTLFLDEIGDLPPLAQAPLLRVLQEGEVLPVGAVRPGKVDLRVVCATHRDLEALVAAGTFRHDLYNRLAAFQIHLPPLRDRLEDLGLLLGARVTARGLGRVALHPQSVRALLAYHWPGNIRELDKVLETSVALAGGKLVLPDHLPPAILASQEMPLGADEARHRDEVIGLLKKHGGNIAAIARDVGKARTQVHRWLKRYGLTAEDYRPT